MYPPEFEDEIDALREAKEREGQRRGRSKFTTQDSLTSRDAPEHCSGASA